MLDGLVTDPVGWILLLISAFCLGVCLGSFSSAIADRTADGTSWVVKSDRRGAARSRCPSCKHQLAWYDLIPLLSWISLWGRCRYCKKQISPFYPLIELAGGVLAAGLLGYYGISILFVVNLTGLPFLLAAILLLIKQQSVPLYMQIVTLGLVVSGILNIIMNVF